MSDEYGNLPFDEQLQVFEDKLDLPTRAWTELDERAHARAFTVAGAQKAELLAELRQGVEEAISGELTRDDWKKRLRQITKKHNWRHKGAPGWRAQVIYGTNLRTSYHAGRFKQMKDVADRRPYWRYRHSHASEEPRLQHLSWDGMVLRHDDPFWDDRYPPNGWGCQCFVETLSEEDLERMGKEPDDAPARNERQVEIGKRDPAPRTVDVPEGVDPGWAHNVGQDKWGKESARRAVVESQRGDWEDLPGFSPASYNRPDRLATDAPRAEIADGADSMAGVRQRLREALDGEDAATFTDAAGARVRVTDALVDEMAERGRSPDGNDRYFGFLPEIIEEPVEIWAAFARERTSGRIGLRRRYLKSVDIDGQAQAFLAEAGGTYWTDLTALDEDQLRELRQGVLVYGRGD